MQPTSIEELMTLGDNLQLHGFSIPKPLTIKPTKVRRNVDEPCAMNYITLTFNFPKLHKQVNYFQKILNIQNIDITPA